MFRKKKGSLELSVNAIVIIVLAITMLGLGLGFLRGMFGKSLESVQKQLTSLDEQTISSLKQDCNDVVCLQSSSLTMKRNDKNNNWMIIYNKFDCDISNLDIKIGGIRGGSTKFPADTCSIVPTENPEETPQCLDITIQNVPTKTIGQKEKQQVLLIVNAKSSAKNTVYSYDIDVKGSCIYAGSTFTLDQKKTITVMIDG